MYTEHLKSTQDFGASLFMFQDNNKSILNVIMYVFLGLWPTCGASPQSKVVKLLANSVGQNK